jgi:hypothetical protein
MMSISCILELFHQNFVAQISETKTFQMLISRKRLNPSKSPSYNQLTSHIDFGYTLNKTLAA